MRLTNLLAAALTCAAASPAFAELPTVTHATQATGSVQANNYGEGRSNRNNGVFVPGLATADGGADTDAPEPAQANNYGDTRSNRREGEFVPGIDTSAGEGSTDSEDAVADADAEPAAVEAKPSVLRWIGSAAVSTGVSVGVGRSSGRTRTVTTPQRPEPRP